MIRNVSLFQVGDRLVQYAQMQVVMEPAENNYLVFHPGNQTFPFPKRFELCNHRSFGYSGCPETLEDQLSTFGQVLSSSALPGRTQALGAGVKQTFVGRSTFVTVATRDWQGNPVITFLFPSKHFYIFSIIV